MAKKKSKGAKADFVTVDQHAKTTHNMQELIAKTPSTETGSGDSSRSHMESNVKAQREARRARAEKHRLSEAPSGFVRMGTLYLAMALALAGGVFIGTLLANVKTPAQASMPATESGATKQQEQNVVNLAEHILNLEESVRKNPNDAAAWGHLGNLYFDAGKAAQAITAYERSLQLKPDDPNVLTDLGIMYREAGKYEQAVQSFRKASQIDPKHQNALFNRGVVLFFDLKRKGDARTAWQELLAVNPAATAPDGKAVKDMLRDLK